jgi:hypothetical protein
MQDLRGIRLDTQEDQSQSSQEAVRRHSAVPSKWPPVSVMLFKHSEELVIGPRLENADRCTANRVTVTQW